jgi:Domain of unknown function (DUF4388)
MTKGRDNTAESLGDVLELVRLRRQNGMLSVERMQAGRFEEGEIYFQGGQPVYARTGQMVGQEALTWLLSWHQVYFRFVVDQPLPIANISGSVAPASPTVSANRNVPVAINAVPLRLPQIKTHGSLPTTPRMPQGGMPGTSSGSRGVPADTSASLTPLIPLDVSSVTPGLELLTPHKVDKERDVLSLPLTRPQRSIYLLVDGHRTVTDLARCTRKSLQEIERLLSELQDRGLIAV